MITTVTGRNQVTIPAEIARRYDLKRGSRLEWTESSQPGEIRCVVLPDLASVAASLRGAGRPYLQPGADPIADLIRERACESEGGGEGGADTAAR
jgi:AbrB family looped-hinge helix DNA binding protein